MSNKTENMDFKSVDAINELQSQLLLKHISYVLQHSPYYQKVFKNASLDGDSIRSLSDLKKIPTTSKKELEKYNDEFVCIKGDKIVEYVTTSGILGDPIAIALSSNDLNRLAYNEARSLEISGINKSDVVQITTTLDKRFMAGMAYYLGATSLGASVVRTGIGNPVFQWENINKFNATTLIAVPSFLYKLSVFSNENGADPNHSTVKKAICIGESIRNSDFSPNKLHDKIIKNWGLDLYSTYASTEMATAFTECEAKKGGHLIPELVIVELLDDEGNEVEAGELGEVTITPLGVEAMPLVRYRTGDLSRAHVEVCSCGRNTLRLGPVEGRKEQMIKLKGTTIFPQIIENVLQGFDTIDIYAIELLDSELGTNLVRVYLLETLSASQISDISEALNTALRVKVDICQISYDVLIKKMFPPGSRKPHKIIDNRTPSS